MKKINLALQGGGAHGAFTWGILDRLLEEEKLEIAGISGTSAGAMNAVALTDGYVKNGKDGAKKSLRNFWEKISQVAAFSPVQRSPIDKFMGNWSIENAFSFQWFDTLTRAASPYDLNPLNFNPLLDLIKNEIDFDCVNRCDVFDLFISATNVNTGRVKIFDRKSLTADMVMASACLPLVFQAIEIDGVPYWDGGYMGNPSLFPLYHANKCDDILIIQINPIERPGPPKNTREITDRINEITFNASLLSELRAIHFVSRLKKEGVLQDTYYQDIKIHIIENQKELNPLGASSKMNAELAFLEHLREIGYETATLWLEKNYKDIGNSSTVDLKKMFAGLTK